MCVYIYTFIYIYIYIYIIYIIAPNETFIYVDDIC